MHTHYQHILLGNTTDVARRDQCVLDESFWCKWAYYVSCSWFDNTWRVGQIVMSFGIICANSVELTTAISRAVRDINKRMISVVPFDKFAMLISFLSCVIWFLTVELSCTCLTAYNELPGKPVAQGRDQSSGGLCRLEDSWMIGWVGEWMHERIIGGCIKEGMDG